MFFVICFETIKILKDLISQDLNNGLKPMMISGMFPNKHVDSFEIKEIKTEL